jgi:isoleucyl-tRNA synthetase
MGSVVMQAEDLRFLDPDLRDVHNRLIQILWNSFKFFEMQAEGVEIVPPTGKMQNVLDLWIESKLAHVGQEVTHSLDRFDTVGATKAIKEFVLDLSTWYIRRSRDRFKGDDQSDKMAALQTSKDVFLTLSKFIAPIMPFIAEVIYKGAGGPQESVHLESWPDTRIVDAEVGELMDIVREVVSQALEARAEAGIKIRQPLPAIIIRDERLLEKEKYLAVIRDEVNVKQIIFDRSQEVPIILDNGQTFINRHRNELENVTGVSTIEFVPLDENVPAVNLYGESMQFVVLPIE